MTTGEMALKGGGILQLLIGLPLCYKANGGDKGQNFLGRYLIRRSPHEQEGILLSIKEKEESC